MGEKQTSDAARPSELLSILGTLQALVIAAREVTMARGAALCAPSSAEDENDLRVIAATGEAPAVGTRCGPTHLTGADRRVPLLGADGSASNALLLFALGDPLPNTAAALEAIQAALGLTLYNAQTIEQSQRAVSESAALREVATEMVTQHELASLLDFIVNTARALLGADYSGLATVDARGGIVWQAMTGYRTDAFRRSRFVLGQGTAGRTIQTRQPVVIENFGTNPNFPVEEFPVHRAEGAKAFFGVPICSGARAFGALTVGYRHARQISAQDLRLASTLADQASVALEQGRLYTQAQQQTRFLENVIQHVPAGIVVVSADEFRVLEVNRFYLQFLEEPFRSGARLLVGATVEEFLPQAEEAGIIAMFRRVIATGEPFFLTEFEYHGFARGVTYWTWSLAPIYNDAGAVQNLLLLVVESTEAVQTRRQVAAAWQLSEERARELDTVITQMADGVVISDATGQIVRINPAGVEMLGHGIMAGSAEDYSHIYQVYTPDGRLYPWEDLPLTRANRGQTVIRSEVVIRRPDGSERTLSINATPLRGDDAHLTGAVAVMRDVTETKETDRLKDEFLSIVSHELRTPLSAILGYSDILLRGLHGPLNERQGRAQMGVRNNAQRLLQLINDLLDVTRLEARELPLLPVPRGLAEAANTAIHAVQSVTLANSVEVLNTINPDLPPVLADRDRLHQILGNLLTNAIKFTPPGGRIVVDARPSTVPADSPPDQAEGPPDAPIRSIKLTVQDTGIGLTTEQAERMWERFYQADSTSSRSYGGTGLGLYIVRTLVGLHGGTIWATSAGRNQGTTIHLRLPLAPGPQANEPRR